MDKYDGKMIINDDQMQWKKPQQPNKSRKPPKSKAVRVLVAVFCVLLVALVGVGVVMYLNVSQIWGRLDPDASIALEDEGADDVEGLPDVTFNKGNVSDIKKAAAETDILLIGVDNRNSSKFSGRSDVMMYLRVNTEKNTIKLVSFMRDTLVEIDGHGKNKLNTAYGFGSIELANRTYYQSFGLKPDYYMVVNFFGMEDILDALGGVDVKIKSDELKSMNKSIKEVNELDPDGEASRIENEGKQHLNGRQAVAYMRVRHPGGDAGRIKRQQTVLNALFSEMKKVSAGEIPGLINAMTKYVRTDMPLGTIMDLATAVKGMNSSKDLETFRYPQDYVNGNYNSMSVVQPKDFDTEFKKLSDFLAG